MQITTDELAAMFGVSLHHIRRYLFELKSHHVLKQGKDGVIFCPVLIRRKYKPHDKTALV